MKLNKEFHEGTNFETVVQAAANLLNIIHQSGDVQKMTRCYKAIEAIFNED